MPTAVEYEPSPSRGIATRIPLIVACFLALAFAAAALVGNFAAQQRQDLAIVSQQQTVTLSAQVLDGQRQAQSDLAEIKRAVVPGARRPAATPAESPSPTPPANVAPAPQADTDAAAQIAGRMNRAGALLSSMQEQFGSLQAAVNERAPLQRYPDLAARFATFSRLIIVTRATLTGSTAPAPAPVIGEQSLPDDPQFAGDDWDQPRARLIPANLVVPSSPAPSPTISVSIPTVAGGPTAANLAWTKLYIVFGMFGALVLTFLIAVVAIFTSSNPAAIAFATDTIKTLLGFFIGVATAFMGAPG